MDKSLSSLRIAAAFAREPVEFNPLRRLVAAVLVRACCDYLAPAKNHQKSREQTRAEALEFLTEPEIMILLSDYFDIPEQRISEVLGVASPVYRPPGQTIGLKQYGAF